MQQSPPQHCSSHWQQSFAYIPFTSFLIKIARLAWFGCSDKGTGEATHNLTSLFLAKLVYPGRQRITQLLKGVAAGYLQSNVLEARTAQKIVVFAIGQCAGDAA